MPRKPRPLDRAGGVVRDASLIVIASEDTYAVEQYFHKFHTTKVLVEVLPTVNGKSSPAAVIERLADYARKWQIGVEDEIWACIDRWPVSGLHQVIAQCHRNGYRIAISSPCFELWIYLHFANAPTTTVNNCSQMTALLATHISGYHKKAISGLPLTLDQVHRAIERAKTLPDPKALTPGVVATGLHEVMSSLQSRENELRLR
jgi:hypothetical protein